MPTKVKYLLNKTRGDEHEIPCIKCSGRTVHVVLASVEERGEESHDSFSFDWSDDYQIVQCRGCKVVSFRQASRHSEDLIPVDDQGVFESVVRETLFPSRREALRGLGDEVHYLPNNVRRIYEETMLAMANQAPVLSAIGLRALIETVCKEKSAAGKDLFKKIDSLREKGVLTPAGAKVLHKIRTLGNEAAHEVKPHSDRQLGLAMDIVQHLLKDVYILPKQVEAEFDK